MALIHFISSDIQKLPDLPNDTTFVIHEIDDDIMKTIEEVSGDYPEITLSFDDGLFSQFLYFDRIKKLPNPKIFYISSKFVYSGKEQTIRKCAQAHEAARTKDYSAYMTWEQINIVQEDTKSMIGMHGWAHLDPDVDRSSSFKDDVQNMFKDFDKNLRPKLGLKSLNYYRNFAFPYNKVNDIYFAYVAVHCKKCNQPSPRVFENRLDITTFKKSCDKED